MFSPKFFIIIFTNTRQLKLKHHCMVLYEHRKKQEAMFMTLRIKDKVNQRST